MGKGMWQRERERGKRIRTSSVGGHDNQVAAKKKKVLLLINLLIGEKNFSFLFLRVRGEKGKGSNQERGRLGVMNGVVVVVVDVDGWMGRIDGRTMYVCEYMYVLGVSEMTSDAI